MNQKALASLCLVAAASINTSTNHTAVDLKGYINPGGRQMKAILNFGSAAGATAVDFKIQDSNTTTAADFTDISGASFTQVATSGASFQEIHFKTNKRYVRAVSTYAGVNAAVWGMTLLAEKRFA